MDSIPSRKPSSHSPKPNILLIWICGVLAVSFLAVWLLPILVDALTAPQMAADIVDGPPHDWHLASNEVRAALYGFVIVLLAVCVTICPGKFNFSPKKIIQDLCFLTLIIMVGYIFIHLLNYDVTFDGKMLSGHPQSLFSKRLTVALSEVDFTKSGIRRLEGLRIVMLDGRRIVLPNERFHRKDQECILAALKSYSRVAATNTLSIAALTTPVETSPLPPKTEWRVARWTLTLTGMLIALLCIRAVIRRRMAVTSADSSETGKDLFLRGLLQNNPSAVRRALKIGADVNMEIPVKDGFDTPLHFAAHAGYDEVCRVLLGGGANPKKPTGRGHLPLHDSLANLKTSVDRRREIARMLVDQGADANSLDWGRPALHFALDNSDLVKELLSLGADVNLPNDYHPIAEPRQGQNFEYRGNALIFALKLGALNDVIKVLIAAGADPLAQNSEGETAWDYICGFPCIPVQKMGLFERSKRSEILRACSYSRSLLQPIVEKAKFDIFVSSASGDGWGEFFLGRLEATGIKIWNSRLINKASSDARRLLKLHIASAPCAVLFLSANTDPDEAAFFGEQFTATPERLLVVVKTGSTALLADHPELAPFHHFVICEERVEDLWVKLCQLTGISGNWVEGVFQDFRAVENTRYDFFCSYRSSCTSTVRFLVEQAIARGAKPWFAEYEILVSGRRFFQELINVGIVSSKRVICCTNSSYAQSDYCRIEAMQVLRIPGKKAGDILNLQMPDDDNEMSNAMQKYGCKAHALKENRLEPAWGEICQFLHLPASTLPTNRTVNPIELKADNRSFQLVTDPEWVIRDTHQGINKLNTVVATFRRQVGSICIDGNLTVGPWTIELPANAEMRDRDLFEAIIKEANKYWNQKQGKIYYTRGVHVIHIPALCSETGALVAHPAFTYLDTGRDDYEGRNVPIEKCTWHRKYSIRVAPPYMPTKVEFCFDFDFKGIAHDDFKTFCRHAYLMDDLVRGLRFGGLQ